MEPSLTEKVLSGAAPVGISLRTGVRGDPGLSDPRPPRRPSADEATAIGAVHRGQAPRIQTPAAPTLEQPKDTV